MTDTPLPLRRRLARARFTLAERAEALLRLDFSGMSRHDRAVWASAQNMEDLGALVCEWLRGGLIQTPGHAGPPCEETIPLIGVLTAANRAGFVTDNSQRADSDGTRSWEAWVTGLASDGTLARLRGAVAGTPLVLTACRGREHDGHRNWMGRCPWREVTGFWADACPAAAAQIRACWHVAIDDPEPGRNDRLWPALIRFASTLEE